MEKNKEKLLNAIYSNDFTQIKRVVKRANKRYNRYLKDRVY